MNNNLAIETVVQWRIEAIKFAYDLVGGSDATRVIRAANKIFTFLVEGTVPENPEKADADRI